MPAIPLNLTVPAPQAERVENAFAALYNYAETVPDPGDPDGPEIPNPQSKADFVIERVKTWFSEVVTSYEATDAASTAKDAAVAANEGVEFVS